MGLRTKTKAHLLAAPILAAALLLSGWGVAFSAGAAAPASLIPAVSAPAPAKIKASAPANKAPAAARVPVRIGHHGTYTRVVFEFPRLLAYHVRDSAGNIQIDFDTKAGVAIAAVKSPLIKSIREVPNGDGLLRVNIATAAGVTFKHYRLERKVVVDVYASAAAPEEKAPAKVAAKAPVKKTGEKPAVKTAEKPAPAPSAAATAPAAPAALPAPPPSAPPPSAPPPAAAAPPKEITRDQLKAALAETQAVLADPAALAAVKLSETEPPPSAAPLKIPAGTNPPPEGAQADKVKPATAGNGDDSVVSDDDVTKISLSFLTPTRLAVFTRADTLWIVTDSTAASAALPGVSGKMAEFLSKPKSLKFEGGRAYLYVLPKKFYLQVRKMNLMWEILLVSAPPDVAPPPDEKVQFDDASQKANLMVPLKDAGNMLAVDDPVVGDTLYVVPTGRPGQAAETLFRFVDLEIIPAAQGLVVRPVREGISITRAYDSVLVTSPSGLTVTPEGMGTPVLIGEADAASDDDNSRLFDFPNWRMGGTKKFLDNKLALQDDLAGAASPEEREGLLMKLAMLYFSNNFGQEALGLLDLVLNEDPGMDKNPDFIALRGAANAMSGHYKEALQDLSFPAIQQRPEVKLWIGFAAAATEQWHMADRAFPKSNRLLLQYPDNIAIPFTIYMAESALHLGHPDTSQKLLDSINMNSDELVPQYRSAIGYLRGETYSQEGKPDKAIEIWKPVARGLDRLYHTKATLSLTRLLLKEKKITLKIAIERIDNLRFAWRGDGLEVEILHTLGSLKIQDSQVLSGMEDLKQAADISDYLLNDSTPIRDEMKRTFADLFVGDQASKIKPLEAVAVYNEFSSLLPPGPEGVTGALNFVNYLIRMDLLGKAAVVMEEQIKNGLPEKDFIAAGTKLAAIYLLDGRPEQALAALKETEKGSLTDTQREERSLLKARAQSKMGQTDAAIATLSTMSSKNARRLKADVQWHARQWSAAAATIETLLPSADKSVSEDDATLVVNAAVAWKLAGNTDKLKEIQSKYATAMAATKEAPTFGVVTRDGGTSSLADRDTMLKIAGEVDMFEGFLNNYKSAAGKGS